MIAMTEGVHMRWLRCQGFMIEDRFDDPGLVDARGMVAWRCINCGEVLTRSSSNTGLCRRRSVRRRSSGPIHARAIARFTTTKAGIICVPFNLSPSL